MAKMCTNHRPIQNIKNPILRVYINIKSGAVIFSPHWSTSDRILTRPTRQQLKRDSGTGPSACVASEATGTLGEQLIWFGLDGNLRKGWWFEHVSSGGKPRILISCKTQKTLGDSTPISSSYFSHKYWICYAALEAEDRRFSNPRDHRLRPKSLIVCLMSASQS